MLLTDPASLTGADIHTLCDEALSESETLDFKRTLDLGLEEKRVELAKDICAFANNRGGDLVYGVSDRNGAASAIMPLVIKSVDETKRRILQMVDSAIEPKITGLQMYAIGVEGGHVLIVRVPQSFDGPHSTLAQRPARRFPVRNGTTTSDMSYDQLRSAFGLTASLAQQARDFIATRIERLKQRQTWKPFVPGPICAAHFVPVAGLARRAAVDLPAVRKNYARFIFKDWGGGSTTANLDGLVVHPGGTDDQAAYTQLFRNGCMESVRTGAMVTRPGEKFIASTTVTRFFRDAISRFLSEAKAYGFAGPAIVACSIVGVSGYRFAIDFCRQPESDRDALVIPDTWLDSIETAELDDIVRPLMDTLWQCFDAERCEEYDATGKWAPR